MKKKNLIAVIVLLIGVSTANAQQWGTSSGISTFTDGPVVIGEATPIIITPPEPPSLFIKTHAVDDNVTSLSIFNEATSNPTANIVSVASTPDFNAGFWFPNVHFIIDGSGRTGIGVQPNANYLFDVGGKSHFYDKVLIGSTSISTSPDYKLFVETGILTEKVKVANSGGTDWSDFVFDDDYKLMTLPQIESYIKENKHLPDIPSAEEVNKDGIDLAQMDAKLLQKIEELTLYVINQQKDIEKLKTENEKLKTTVRNISKQH